MSNKQKTIGIVGGMGPLATADLFTKIIQMTDAGSDAEHIHIIIDNNPKTPDRTSAILKGTESPLPYLVRSAERLHTAGADFLLIPCITSHHFLPELTKQISVPVVNMIEETAKHLVEQKIQKAVVLATDGTRQSKVFDTIFANYGVEVCYPSSEAQQALMDVIYKGVKAGLSTFDTSVLNREIEKLISQGAEVVILGCTELPLAAQMYGIAGNLVNPTDILAQAAIQYAGYSVK